MSDVEPRDPYGGQPGYPPPWPVADQRWMAGHPYGPPLGYGYGLPPVPVVPQRRPGATTGSSVLGYVTAALLVIASIVLFSGASLLNDIGDAVGANTSPLTTEFVLDGVADLATAALLVWGGVLLARRSPSGQALLTLGCVLVVSLSIYWVTRFDSTAALFPFAVVVGTLAVIAAGLACNRETRTWLLGAPAHDV